MNQKSCRRVLGRLIVGAAVWSMVFSSLAQIPPRTIPQPLPGHPGNIFVAGETVSVSVGTNFGRWVLEDYSGHEVSTGLISGGLANLDALSVGYYELADRDGGATNRPISLGVLEQLRAPTPMDSPIGIDVALSWCFAPKDWPTAISFCQLAGMNRVRDRVFWGEMEPKRGEYSETNRNDKSVELQTAGGLQVLDVNHASPPWANPNGRRMPLDLRDVHDGYRELARRWHGKIAAFEPWNEADLPDFGGHTGDEMASLQKAAYLGMKAGDPTLIVCQNVFGIHRQTTLRNFNDNRAWPYFDTFNLHHYEPLTEYPKLYADFRAVSAGRPLWATECSWTIDWSGDEQLKEPTTENAHIQAERLVKTYAESMHEGAEAVFYFMLPHYAERKIQYGLLHPDLTPRPAFLSLAAVGRFLAAAKPLGRIDNGGEAFNGYCFTALPDGKTADVLVVWSEDAATLKLPKAPVSRYDLLGRALPVGDQNLSLLPAPQFVVLAENSRPHLVAPPKPAPRLTGKASSVIFQALLPEDCIDLKRSGYDLKSGAKNDIPIYAYNFGVAEAKGELTISAPQKWSDDLPKQLTLKPGERKQIILHLVAPPRWEMAARVNIQGYFGKDGDSILALRFFANQSEQ